MKRSRFTGQQITSAAPLPGAVWFLDSGSGEGGGWGRVIRISHVEILQSRRSFRMTRWTFQRTTVINEIGAKTKPDSGDPL